MAGTSNGIRRWQVLSIAAVLVAVIALIVALVVAGDDDEATPPSSSTTSSEATTTTMTATTTTTAPASETATAVWPTASDDVRYDDPVAAAVGFATDFVGFTDPVVGEFQQGDARSGEVEIRPRDDGPVTTVFVRQLTADDTWWVLGSATASIEITAPEALAEIASPVAIAGRSTAFEAVVNVELRADGQRDALAESFVMGGANGEMGPFEGTVSFDPPAADAGALVLFTLSAENGQVLEASVLRVRFGPATGQLRSCAEGASQPPPHGDGETVVTVYFTCEDDIDGDPVAVHRVVPSTPGLLQASLEQLLAGPTPDEAAAGFTSWFSEATSDLLVGVVLGEDGTAVVDFGDLRSVIPNASSSAGSRQLLSQLDATVFQFPSVESARYRLDGDCDAWGEWLQFSGCEATR